MSWSNREKGGQKERRCGTEPVKNLRDCWRRTIAPLKKGYSQREGERRRSGGWRERWNWRLRKRRETKSWYGGKESKVHPRLRSRRLRICYHSVTRSSDGRSRVVLRRSFISRNRLDLSIILHHDNSLIPLLRLKQPCLLQSPHYTRMTLLIIVLVRSISSLATTTPPQLPIPSIVLLVLSIPVFHLVPRTNLITQLCYLRDRRIKLRQDDKVR